MRRLLARAGFALAMFALGIAGPSGQAMAKCGEFHRVQRGETLRSITIRHYAHDNYRLVFEGNRDILGDPSQIEVGQLIYLPCQDTGPRTREAALQRSGHTPSQADQLGNRLAKRAARGAIAVVSPETIAKPAPARSTPRPSGRLILSGSGFAPLTDEALDEGGLIAKLVMKALDVAQPGTPSKLAFVNDWKSHLSILMPTGSFALAFPWPQPSCAAGGAGPASQAMCGKFLFSRPLYEVPISIWTRRGDGLADSSSLAQLAGKRICRPRAFPPVDLEAAGLPLGIATGKNAADCARMLLTGEVDAMSIPQPMEASLYGDKDLLTRAAPVPLLTRSVPVHALAWAGAPDAEATIADINAGLAELQKSGEWFEIVSRYLSDYNARVAKR